MDKRILFAIIALIASTSTVKLSREGPYYWHTVSEKKGNVCSSDMECDGVRTCVKEVCYGIARPPKNDMYYYSETQTGSACISNYNDPK